VRFVIDASVAAKWYNDEELSDKAVEVKDAFVRGDLELAAPTHLIYEVGNSIWKNPQLSDKDATNAVVSILRLGMQMLPPNTERANRAMNIARMREVTFYDACYIQSAEELRSPLLTSDDCQGAAGKGIVQVTRLREAKV